MISKIILLVLDVIVTINSARSARFGRKVNMSNVKDKTKKMSLLTFFNKFLGETYKREESAITEKKECVVEKNLYDLAKSYEEMYQYEFMYARKSMYVEREHAPAVYRLMDEMENSIWACYIPSDFYGGEEPFKKLRYKTSSRKPSAEMSRFLCEAKKLVCDYIDSSNIIKAEHKELVKNGISGVNFEYITVNRKDNSLNNVPMLAHDTTIYVNERYSNLEIVDLHMVVHELIHIVSHLTARISDYTSVTFFDRCLISECITEMIAREIMRANNLPVENEKCEITYIDSFEYVYALLAKCDILKAYYYGHTFDEIMKTNINKKAFETYYLAVAFMSEEDKMDGKINVIWQLI